jgi:prolyl 4-hydroxylase
LAPLRHERTISLLSLHAGPVFFKWRQDGTFRRSESEESFLTFIIYLNDDYKGGATEFPWEKIAPKAGSVLVFPHRLRHQGAQILEGTKYVLRTDVMYWLAAA